MAFVDERLPGEPRVPVRPPIGNRDELGVGEPSPRIPPTPTPTIPGVSAQPPTSSIYQRRLQEFIRLRQLLANQLNELARGFLELQYQRRGVEQKQAAAMARRKLALQRKKFELQKRMGQKQFEWAEEDIPSWLQILGQSLMEFGGSYATRRGMESVQQDWLNWLRQQSIPEPLPYPSGPMYPYT